MHFLVTGGAGFIGSHLVEKLCALGHTITVIDDFSTGKRENLAFAKVQSVKILEGDIRDLEFVQTAMRDASGVFHLAALVSVPKSIEAPKLSFDINVNGTMNVFEAARKEGVRRIVYASSAAVYGNSRQLPLAETSMTEPLSPYGLDKLHTERIGELYHKLYRLEPIALRFFNVYGPRQDPKSPYSGVISIFLEQMLNGHAPKVFGDGEQSRDFIYVRDIVQASIKAMLAEYPGFRAYNVGTGQASSLNFLIDCLKNILQLQINMQYFPARGGDIRHSLADIALISKELHFQPACTLEEGLRSMLSMQKTIG